MFVVEASSYDYNKHCVVKPIRQETPNMQLSKFCADVKREVTIVRLQASAKNVEGWTLENRAFEIKYFIQLCQKVLL